MTKLLIYVVVWTLGKQHILLDVRKALFNKLTPVETKPTVELLITILQTSLFKRYVLISASLSTYQSFYLQSSLMHV